MIPRYTRPEMGRIWSDQNRFQQWLEVELAASEALASLGVVPHQAARLLRAHAGFDVARIHAIEKEVKHDVERPKPFSAVAGSGACGIGSAGVVRRGAPPSSPTPARARGIRRGANPRHRKRSQARCGATKTVFSSGWKWSLRHRKRWRR